VCFRPFIEFLLPLLEALRNSHISWTSSQGSGQLDVGVGICSGEEYVGNVGGGGFKDLTALGDVTNTLARLQAQTKGGEVLMRSATHAAAVDACAGAELRQLSLKGKAEPVAQYLIRVP
jgi:adenylate cyclase